MRGSSENMKSGRPVNQYIFETLFDNVGFRQIIFSLFLIHNKEVKVKVKFPKMDVCGDKYAFQEIEDIVGKLMKSKKNSNFEKINMEDFMKNFLAIPELVAIIQ